MIMSLSNIDMGFNIKLPTIAATINSSVTLLIFNIQPDQKHPPLPNCHISLL